MKAAHNPSSTRWRKSSRSGETGDNCVEVAVVDGLIAVRDSKNPSCPAVTVEGATWRAFVTKIKANS